MELGVGLVRVSRKGSPSVPGSSIVNFMCGSMELIPTLDLQLQTNT